MNDTFFVRRFEAGGDLARVVERGIERQRPAEVGALDQFHDDGAGFDAVDLRDVGWLSEASTCASRWQRCMRAESSARAGGNTLMATSRLSRVSLAR